MAAIFNNTFQNVFSYKNACISIEISLKYVPGVQTTSSQNRFS